MVLLFDLMGCSSLFALWNVLLVFLYGMFLLCSFMGWCYGFPLWAVPNVVISGMFLLFSSVEGPWTPGEGGLGMDKSF